MRNSSKFLIIGASGHAGVILDELHKNDSKSDILLCDDNLGLQCCGYKVHASIKELILKKIYLNREIIIGIGDNSVRKEIFCDLNDLHGVKFCNVISKDSYVSKFSTLGFGNLVVTGAIINHGVVIGNNSIINTSATVDHECTIGSNVHIAPGANLAGNVNVCDDVLIGIGASIAPNIKIGKNCIIGSGAVVIKDVKPNTTVLGNPADEK